MNDHPTEKIRTDEALRERLKNPSDWSDDTKTELLVAALSKTMHTEKATKKSSLKANLALVGVVLGILTSAVAMVTWALNVGERFVVSAASEVYAKKTEVEAVRVEVAAGNRRWEWFIRKMLPFETPPSFEEGRGKDEPRR